MPLRPRPRLRRLAVLREAVAPCVAAVAVLAAATPLTAQTSGAAAAKHAMPQTYRALVAPNGAPPIELHVEELGSGPPLLLLHGLAASTYSWRHVMPALARRHRVIALDLRGFGKSDKPFDQSYTPGDQARHVVDFIERRGLRGLTLVGHSFGGAVALLATLQFNARDKGRIRRLVLLDTPAYPQEPTALVQFLRQPVLPYAVLTLVPPEVATAFALQGERDAGTAQLDDIIHYAAPFRDAAARHALISTARQLRPRDWRRVVAAYPSIHQPALLVWCRQDDVVPVATGRRLARALPRARLHLLDGCAHSPQDEQPRKLLSLMRRFLD